MARALDWSMPPGGEFLEGLGAPGEVVSVEALEPERYWAVEIVADLGGDNLGEGFYSGGAGRGRGRGQMSHRQDERGAGVSETPTVDAHPEAGTVHRRRAGRRPGSSSGAVVGIHQRRRHPRPPLPAGTPCMADGDGSAAFGPSPLGHHRTLEAAATPSVGQRPTAPPRGCAGALLWPLWDQGQLVGVVAEGLDTEGRRRGPDPRHGYILGRWRRTVGEGGLCGTRIRDDGPALVLEGPLDGLAARRVASLGVEETLARCRPLWAQPAASGWVDALLQVAEAGVVIASGGTARLPEAAAAAARRRDRVVILTDADLPGAAAAIEAATAVRITDQAQVTVLRSWAEPGTPEDLAAAAEHWPLLTEHTSDNTVPEAPE